MAASCAAVSVPDVLSASCRLPGVSDWTTLPRLSYHVVAIPPPGLAVLTARPLESRYVTVARFQSAGMVPVDWLPVGTSPGSKTAVASTGAWDWPHRAVWPAERSLGAPVPDRGTA